MTLLSAVDAREETPVDRWLAEQADLTAVERFAQQHSAHTGPVQERYYRDLVPTAAPAPGQQYAFKVDLDACTGCKACVVACHSLNGLDEDESWRRVSRVVGERGGVAAQQTVTAACHHCADPACMKGCPVDAYEKDPVTGIVKHLDDQCIGCSYCTLTCPYEVPAFNHRLGIVRKCDMCSDRLAEGEAPACVQGCPNEAISITLIDQPARGPSTVYVSSKPTLGDPVLAGVQPNTQSHPALAVMLVLTQLSVGAFVTEFALGRTSAFDSWLIAAVGLLAMGASVLHLGRPLYAYRAVIGLRHSWLSREILAFGAFMPLALAYAIRPLPMIGSAAAAMGVLGVLCSVLIYATTPRWNFGPVFVRFLGGAAIAGVVTVLFWPVLPVVVALQLYERQRFFTR